MGADGQGEASPADIGQQLALPLAVFFLFERLVQERDDFGAEGPALALRQALNALVQVCWLHSSSERVSAHNLWRDTPWATT